MFFVQQHLILTGRLSLSRERSFWETLCFTKKNTVVRCWSTKENISRGSKWKLLSFRETFKINWPKQWKIAKLNQKFKKKSEFASPDSWVECKNIFRKKKYEKKIKTKKFLLEKSREKSPKRRRTAVKMPPSKLDAVYRSLLLTKFFSKVISAFEVRLPFLT